jgi:hypothetical protein
MRTSAAPRRACSPSERSSAGAKLARSAAVGGTCKPPTSGVAARMTLRSIWRARRDSISCPQNARSSACATVASRTGLSPRRWTTACRSSGSRRKRWRNGAWSSSSASMNRSRSTAARDRARRTIVPSTRCHAAPSSPPGSAAVTTPLRTIRVASPPRSESASEYAPRGRIAVSITYAPYDPGPTVVEVPTRGSASRRSLGFLACQSRSTRAPTSATST